MANETAAGRKNKPNEAAPARPGIAPSRIEAGIFPFLLILPAIIVIALVIAFPLLYSLYVSFTPYELLRPNSLNFTLSKALRNYQKLLNDAIFGARWGIPLFSWLSASI